jgi:hypothetical protein
VAQVLAVFNRLGFAQACEVGEISAPDAAAYMVVR